MHRKVLDKGDKPTVSVDYKAFGESEHDDDKIQMVVVKDESTGCVSAHVCEAKGAGDRWVVDRICDDIGLWGHTELIIKGDGEPALIQVQEAIKDKWNHKTVPQNPPAYNPQASGAAERAVQEIMGEIRALKIGLEQRNGIKIPTSFKTMEWIVELVPVIFNRCLVEHDGKTPYSRLMDKHSSKEMVEIGERVLANVVRSRRSTRTRALQPRWEDATWVGVARRSNEHIVVLEQGGQAIRCRSVRRRPEVNKWDAEKMRNIVASPRMPNPEDPSRPDFDIDRTRLPRPVVPAEDVGRAQARPISEPVRRDIGITKRVLERYDYTAGCPGCNAALSNKPRREHNKECREDPEDLLRIIERDIRFERPNRDDERSPEEGSPDSVEGRQPEHAVWMLKRATSRIMWSMVLKKTLIQHTLRRQAQELVTNEPTLTRR